MSKEAIEHYEAALKEAFPSGATGNVFYHWNEARKALAEQPAQGCDYCNHPQYAGTKCKNCGREQPAQQEPVAWMDGYRNIYSLEEKAAGCAEATIALVPMANQEKTSGSPINEFQCVCGAVWLGEEMVHLPDKRPPAQRTWVGLTDDEILYCVELENPKAIAEEVEAKLKEKNT